MNTMNITEMKAVNAGGKMIATRSYKVRCVACKKIIKGNIATQYAHCFKHGAKMGWQLWSAIRMFF
ncbi:MAG: hypothetical protein J6C82_06155 [Clostridia bacterium]|nr:hypothetical protein [Clostridia bacterium]